MRRPALFGFFALAATCVLAAQVGAAGGAGGAASRGSSAVTPSEVVSPNWSGYVAVAPKKSSYADPYFTSVTGTWTVPTARCRKGKDATTSSTVWVGLGGYLTHDQEEVGTDSNCGSSGKPSYYAWFELVPYASYKTFPDITDTVTPGDTITGLVTILTPRLVELRVNDATRRWTFTTKITFSSQDTSTADWVVEAPAECVLYYCHATNLSNFGSVALRRISAVGRGSTGTLSDTKWKVTALRLVPGKELVPTFLPGPDAANSSTPLRHGKALSPAGADPSPLSRNGTSFKVTWVPVASRAV